MPNWCKGVLKVRGPMENIAKFLLEGIDYNRYQYVPGTGKDGKFTFEEVAIPREDITKEIDDQSVYITNTEGLYVKNTRRMFIASNNIDDIAITDATGNTSLICVDVEQAWNIEAENLATISAKYGVDFRIFATESGMEFCQEIEVINGKITIDREVPYNDFWWEAPDPRIGG